MTNSKQTKRALLSSVMALLLCFTMLLGTTFAWFTDTASTSVNTIQAGTLDVQLLDSKGGSLEGKTLSWQKVAGHESEAVLWEPGCTYSLQDITIKNNGNLALKYKVVITGIDGSAKLNEVIDWTIKVGNDTYSADSVFKLSATESHTLTISGKMQETAGNAYQGETIEGISITVYATQDTVEYDSTTNEYDKDATYAPMANVSALADKTVSVKMYGQNNATNKTLDTAYSFKTTENATTAAASNYAKYHADFVVTANKDVAADSMMLAGFYSAYCSDGNWIGLQSNSEIKAGEEIRLVSTLLNGTTINYEELCQYIPEFKCGAVNLNGNSGTTITVELRLYEIKADATSTNTVDAETGDYIVIGTYSYTFK